MKRIFAIALTLGLGLALTGHASAQGAGAFSYQKQWWPDAAIAPDGQPLGSGEAYEYAGPSGPDLWNDPRAWWPDYQFPREVLTPYPKP